MGVILIVYSLSVALVFAVFLLLSQVGIVSWPLVWVYSPLWIGAVLHVIAAILGFIISDNTHHLSEKCLANTEYEMYKNPGCEILNGKRSARR